MSASLESAPQSGVVPRWRVAVIAIVAVLAAAIGLATGSFLLTARASAIGGAASYVPASAAMYMEVRLSPSAGQDASLRELLRRLPPIEGLDLDRPLFDQLGEVVDSAMQGEGSELTWSRDVAPWFSGRLAVGIVEIPAAALDPTFDPFATPAVPEMVILVGVTDAAEAQASIDRIIETSGGADVPFATREHRGVTIHAVEGGADGMGAWALTDDQLLIAPTAQDIVAALDTRAEGTTIADDPELTQLSGRLPDDWLALVSYDLTDMVALSLRGGARADPSMDAFATLLAHQPMRAVMTVTATDDGLAFDGVSAPPTGPLAVENADRGLAREVPADALYFAEGGNLGAALEAFVTAMKATASADPFAADGIATAESALGADLEELVAWIGDGAMVAGWDATQPYAGLVLVPEDRQAAQRRLGQLSTFAGLAAMDPSSGVTVGTREAAGVTITTIRWADPTMMMMSGAEEMALVVEYALTDDRALVGFGDRFVARVLELEPNETLTSAQRYVGAVGALGGPEATGIGWIDLSGILAAAEQAFGDELDDPAYRAEIRPWLAPWDRFVGVSRIEDGLHVQRSVLLIR